MDFSQFQIKQLSDLLSSPAGAVGTLFLAALLIGSMAYKPFRWISVALLIYVSALGSWDVTKPTSQFFSPLEQIRSYGRVVCVVLLLILLAPTLREHNGWRLRTLSAGYVLYYLFQIVSSLRWLGSGNFDRGFFGAIVFTLMFMVFGIGMGRWMQQMEDATNLVRCLVWTAILFIVFSFMQMGINRAAVFSAGRFIGTTNNANHCGAFLATVFLPVCYLALRPQARALARTFLYVLMVLILLLALWAASRTGLVMIIAGVLVMFRRRMGSFLLGAALCSVLVLIGIQFFAENQDAVQQAFRTEDTRTGAWLGMWNDFCEAPLIGKAGMGGWSENSYLFVASRVGCLGLVPFLTAIGLIIRDMLRLARQRSCPGADTAMADLVLGGLTSLFVGGMFEGFLYGTFTCPMFGLYVYVGLMTFLLDRIRVATADAQQQQAVDAVYAAEEESVAGLTPEAEYG